jgi:hypothetical protein
LDSIRGNASASDATAVDTAQKTTAEGVRDADNWQAAFHAEAPIVDPKKVLAKTA